MRRKRVMGVLGIVAALIGAMTLFIWLLAATGPGHRCLESLVASFTDGRVRVDGLGGDMFGRLRAERIAIADEKGVWLKIENVDLRWRAFALIRNRADIAALKAARVVVARKPIPGKKKTESDSDFSVAIGNFHIDRIEIGRAVFGQAGLFRATGGLHYASIRDAAAKLAVDRLDVGGRYRVDLAVAKGRLRGHAVFSENGDGFIGGMAGLPGIGPVRLTLDAGMTGGRNAIALNLSAGALAARLQGAIDLNKDYLGGRFALDASAMTPRPGLSFAALHGHGRIEGSFKEPDIAAELAVSGLTYGRIGIGRIDLKLEGKNGLAGLNGDIRELALPFDKENAIAAAPLRVSARMALNAAPRPLHVAIDHPLSRLRLDAVLGERIGGKLIWNLPDLRRLAGLGGLELQGSGRIAVDFRQNGKTLVATLGGEIDAKGASPLARLLGRASLTASAEHREGDTDVEAVLTGTDLKLTLNGAVKPALKDVRAKLRVGDVSKLVSALSGSLSLDARLLGRGDGLKLAAEGKADIAPAGMKQERIALFVDLDRLARQPAGSVEIHGRFAGAALQLAAEAKAEAGATRLTLRHGAWKSLSVKGDMVLGGRPRGAAVFAFGDLSDLAPIAAGLAGSAEAKLVLDEQEGQRAARLSARIEDFRSEGMRLGEVRLGGAIVDASRAPRLNFDVKAERLEAGGVKGGLTAKLSGPLDAVEADLSSDLETDLGPVRVKARVAMDGEKKRLAIESLNAHWNGRDFALAEPAQLAMDDGTAQIAVKIVSGSDNFLELRGTAPTEVGRGFDMRIAGGVDLAQFNSLLSADGRSMRGVVRLDVALRGTRERPEIDGKALVAGGQYRDFAAGIDLNAIDADIVAAGDKIKLERFKAKAGGGGLTGEGGIDLAGDMPVALTFTAKHARPFARDEMKTTLNGAVKLEGALKGDLAVTGQMEIEKGEIHIPDSLPPNIAVLDVRRRGAPPPPASKPGKIKLALTLSAPGQLFLRGRGLNAELQGKLRVAGSTGRPRVLGKLTMRRGNFSLGGTTLEFKSGSIGFAETGADGGIDPSLDFIVETVGNGVTATLNIAGTASKPKVKLTSSPELPQDEILSQLLFQQKLEQLSPVQLAQIAQSLAMLSGLGPGFDPVGSVRSGLGLDRLTVSSAAGASGAEATNTVEAGKYVMRDVYVGAKQELGGGTKALVQVDLSRHLKLRASVNASSSGSALPSTNAQDKGDTVGLSYEIEY